ncbi:retrovirus-related pol polyprotein from transposon TNT 1-94 [Tanacetum coccineum]
MGTSRTYTPGASGSNSEKQRTVICYNCKGEGHMSKQCTKPKRKRDDSWFKDKVLLVQAQANDALAEAMPSSEQSSVINNSEIEITSDSNIISYSQYVKESQQTAVQNSDSSAQQDALILSVIEQLENIVNNLDNSVSNQIAPNFGQYFELNELIAQSQDKNTVIKKLKERIKSLSRNINKDKVKKDIEEIETINIELDHRVSKLIAENEHLK